MVDFDEARPLWTQLVDEFHRRIGGGQWKPGNRIPSVRELALELGVNPNTVQKALAELDREGLTLSERTAGRYVADDQNLIRSTRSHLAGHAATAYVETARAVGLKLAEALNLVEQRWESKEGA